MTSKNTLETQLHDMAASHFKPNEPGASIIVMRDGEPLLRAGFGLANIELGVSIQPDFDLSQTQPAKCRRHKYGTVIC